MQTDVDLDNMYALIVSEQHVKLNRTVVVFKCAKMLKKKTLKEKNVLLVMVREKSSPLDYYFSLKWRPVAIINTSFYDAF